METTYVDIPTNFISRKSESPFNKQQLNHNMSIPLVQIPLFEKMSLYKESEKKIEAQRALKLKLKALGKFHKSGVKPPKSPRGHEPMENKSVPGLPTIWSYRINQTVQDLKSKNSMNLALNNTKPEAYLDKSRVLDDDPYKSLTSEPDTLRAINNLAGNFFVKSHFTSPKAHRQKLSETNYNSLVKDNSVEGAKNRVKTLHDMPSPSSPTPTPKVLTKPPQSPQTRGSSLGKIPEIRRFVISPKRDVSPEIPFFAYGGSPRSSKAIKPSMLTLLKDKGTMSQNSLLNSFLNSKEEKGSPTPTSPKSRANKLVKTFYQDPTSMRLFHDQKKSDKRIEDMEEDNFDFEQDVVLNSTPAISIPAESIYLKPQSSQQSPEPLSPEKVKSKHSMRSLQKSPTQLKLNNQKAKQPRMQKRMETIALKLSQRMTQFNPIFDVDTLDATDPYLKPFVSKAREKNLPPIARRTLEMIIVQRRLLKRLEKIRNLKLTLQEVMRSDEIFATQPYARPGSKELLIYVKLGKTDKVKELLQETQKYIVYDFDHVHLTALHWAAKKSFNDIAKILIDYGADVDAKDVIGRTPLYFAIQNKNEDLVKMLLANWAEPWSTEDTNYKEVLRGKEVISYYLSKMKKVHIGMKLTPPHQRALFWQREAIEFLNSYMHPLSDKKIEEKKGGTLRWYKGALNGFTMKV